MKIKFNFKNFEPSEHLKKYARTRLEKISKYIIDSENAELQVNLEVEKFRHIAEVILTGKNLHISANEESEDMYSSIDLIVDKVEAQVKKIRDKEKDRHKKKKGKSVRMDVISFSQSESGQKEPVIVQTDQYEPKPMSVEEAAMQLDTLNYDFLVFLNADTERVNVIYRRKNGDFGLIDPGI
ncbi:ribosome-associated translation inhibitor RaiA [Desulfohalobiaceae bacterium Ax17]|uniref:ribosome hibernation-promoting factor, HPF/YfiA family n=1 Tax=Desulfovulcanus ferrireducens TaxID=2831190 RepID=UPI00207BACD8|nr:ribosome-associated translation inhibitor RaiA [Desulfovulcanus ferrireducens]MBT8763404.1 ribosome-associated translation inhibitor RaiA [Desulfovulcanus ferrireducens]